MATGDGMACWFTRAEVEPRVGGSFMLDFGPDAKSHGSVTACGRAWREWFAALAG